jgi:predicted nucleotidyltransferase
MKVSERYKVSQAILFGSRARGEHRQDSDADLAVVIDGEHGRRIDIAMDMADTAFTVLLDAGILIEALPVWTDEIEHPEIFSNSFLMANIKNEGIRV